MTATHHTSTTVSAPVMPVAPTALRPLGMDDVRLSGGFWGERQELNGSTIIPHCLHWETKVGWIANFDAAREGTVAQSRTGRQFADSDVYKLLEAMAWEIGRTGDARLQAELDAIVARIEPVQREDGYLNTCFGNPGQADRYTDFEWGHELYNVGHLLQAAVARLRTGFDTSDPLVRIALRAAEHVCDTFGEGGLERVGGHPEIEVALVELYRATGREEFLTQARVFLDRRGSGTLADIEFGRSYYQDDQPIREATDLRGHAVRALYLAAGAIDAALESGDSELFDIAARQYANALARRTYITGGMGSHHQDEAFGADHELPADRAYCETCAGVASVMVAWRLLLATGDLSYGDVIERTLYNVVATSPAADGTAFFYTNTLHQRVSGQPAQTEEASPRALGLGRAPWFEVSCCPTNVARTIAQLGTYVATASPDGVQLLQYVSGTVRAALDADQRVALEVQTSYPYASTVAVTVTEAPEREWELALRIPAWAQGATVDLGDGSGPRSTAGSVFRHRGRLSAGTRIVLEIPTAPRWTFPHPSIDAVRGTVAAERGPLVLCAESIDQDGGADVSQVRVDPSVPLEAAPEGGAVATGALLRLDAGLAAYAGAPGEGQATPASIRLIPYQQWGNRGPSTMRVWLPTTPS